MKYLTQDELKRLLEEIPNARQRLMIKVGFLHGLRVSEIINLTKENIKDGYINVQRLKGSLKTVQPFVFSKDENFNEKTELEQIYNILKPGEKLFSITRYGVYKLIKRAGIRAGIPSHKLHPHALKHSCAMLSIDKMGIQKVKQYLGHRNIGSTAEYLKESDETASKAFAEAMV